MNKRNILILIFLFCVAIALRLWHLDVGFSPSSFGEDIYGIFLGNSFGFLNKLILSFFSLPYICIIKPYLPVIWGVLGIWIIYLIGLEGGVKNKENSGLFCLLLASVNPFLIGLSFIDGLYSLIFLLSSLVVLYSLKSHNTKSKRDEIFLLFFSLLLIFTYTPSLFFVIFNFISIFVFHKKHKGNMNTLLSVLGLVVLLCPTVPFIINMVQNPGFLSSYGLSFDWWSVLNYFRDIFSVGIFAKTNTTFYNFGSILFVFIPTLISLLFVIKSFVNIKKEEFYSLFVVLSTFLSFVILGLMSGYSFSSLYLICLLPLLILSFGKGFFSLKSENVRMILFGIYLCVISVYIILSHFPTILFF